MTQKALRLGLLTLLLAAAAPGVASAAGSGNDCSPLGAWFGVVEPDNLELTGWMLTTTGRSSDKGEINFEARTFDPTLGGYFPDAVPGGSDKGVWHRTAGNTFEYSFMGIAVNSSNEIEYIGRTSGTITILDDCNTEEITAVMAVYLPTDSPFEVEDEPVFEIDLGEIYGYRFTLP